MKIRSLGYALSMSAATALLVGCGGSQGPVGATGVLPQGITIDATRDQLPLELKSANLLYVTDPGANYLYVLTYPQGLRIGGFSSGLLDPWGACVDSAGDVFVANSARSRILIYNQGSFNPPTIEKDSRYRPADCAIDPTTGALAVANASTINSGPGNVAIYKYIQGPRKLYKDPDLSSYSYCGYDNKGDLFVDGENNGTTPTVLAELAKGATSLSTITVDKTLGSLPGPVEWDGSHIVLGDPANRVAYQLSIVGSHAKVVGTTVFASPYPLDKFTIVGSGKGKTLIGPGTGGHGEIFYWHYPGGGSAFKTIGGFRDPYAVVLSPGQK